MRVAGSTPRCERSACGRPSRPHVVPKLRRVARAGRSFWKGGNRNRAQNTKASCLGQTGGDRVLRRVQTGREVQTRGECITTAVRRRWNTMASPPPFFPVATDALERDDISEVIPERLFITNWRSGSDRGALHNLKVTHIAAIGEEFLESEEDIEGITYYKHGERSPARHITTRPSGHWRQ